MLKVPRIAVVGAGECGARAAFALRSRGFEGLLTLIGGERHLPYERPPLSKSVCGEVELYRPVARGEEYAAAAIDLRLGIDVVGIDRSSKRLILSDDSTISYDKLLLATGARARRLPGVPVSGRIHTLRTFEDALAIREALRAGASLAIIGGGFIGLELAAAARSAGCRVTVIETQDRLLKRAVPEDIACIVANRHRQEGVEIVCGAEQVRLAVENGMPLIAMANRDSITPDHVVVGIGAIPNNELALNAGLEIDNGIAVDEYLQTSDPDIYAAGDCCSFPLPTHGNKRIRLEAWRNAQEQSQIVSANLLGERCAVNNIPWFWSDQYEMSLQIAGLPSDAVRQVRRDLPGGGLLLFHLDQNNRIVGASGIGQGNSVAKHIRLSEMLIAAGQPQDLDELSSPNLQLKSLLKR
ncbi:FAD-dependent oxidoreductase (plasmid) [Sinorhizobium chiapasense]|uniref:NAD(P)/FAD-dependent oxidoreductase n=1 Tax=Sinorhizobium chiapasense TaxID=501572 RepID=UPI002FE2E06A